MKYSIEEAKEYSDRNELDKWLQSFLRDTTTKHPGDNIPLADGLLLEDRFYIGPILINLSDLETVRIEKDIEGNDLDYYNEVVSRMSSDYKDYNFPPFIVEYKNNKLILTDGNHRYSALKKLNISEYYVIIWGNKSLEKELLNKLNLNKKVFNF